MTTNEQKPYLNTREDAAFRFLGIPTLIRSKAETTNGAFGLIEHWEMPVGFGSPYHTHHREDEAFYVLEGEVGFVCDGKWLKAGPGTFVYGPREIPHGFKVIGSSPARMLVMCTPGGFERFVLEQTTPIDEPPSPPARIRFGAGFSSSTVQANPRTLHAARSDETSTTRERGDKAMGIPPKDDDCLANAAPKKTR